jgi:hypothetical protein
VEENIYIRGKQGEVEEERGRDEGGVKGEIKKKGMLKMERRYREV